MTARRPTSNELLDKDLAIIIVFAPVWISYFSYLIIRGWLEDRPLA